MMAMLGHEVRTCLVSHHGLHHEIRDIADVRWTSLDILNLGIRGVDRALRREAESFSPEWVVGCSDAWYGWLAHRVATHTGSKLAVDAYDNYEAYMPWNLPLHWAWRRAIKAADLVTAAGPQLATRLQQHRQGGRSVEILSMAADPSFVAMDRALSRKSFGLPDTAPLIGYSGGWALKRGTHVLLDSFQRVLAIRPDARLILSGHPPADVRAAPGVVALGYLDDAQMPAMLSALNVACVITADTAFGRYSYPAKLCEAMACRVSVVATATEPIRWMLNDNTRFLVTVGNAEDIAAHILANLDAGQVDYGKLPSWREVGRRFDALLSG